MGNEGSDLRRVPREGIRSSWCAAQHGELAMLTSEALGEAGLANAFSLQPDNMGLGKSADLAAAFRRRQLVCQSMSGEDSRLVCMQQVHGCRIATRESITFAKPIDDVDGVIVDRRGVVAAALSADCPTVAVLDLDRRVFGLVHAGWRGTVAGLTRKLVQTMVGQFGCAAERMVAAITPCAGPCCYEVGDDVLEAVLLSSDASATHVSSKGDSSHLDLGAANLDQLQREGVVLEHIDFANVCTICDERFYSYRRDGAATGHAAFFVSLG